MKLSDILVREIRFDRAQTLTDAQKTQAKANMGISNAAGGSIPTVLHDQRTTLRTMTPTAGNNIIVEGLGVFVFYVGSTKLDDDETCFATSAGRWILEAASPDMLQAEIFDLQVRTANIEETTFLKGSFVMSMTSLASLSSVDFKAAVAGAEPGDSVIVNPGNSFGNSAADEAALSYTSFVSAPDTITVTIRNASAASAAMTTSTWTVMVIKQK